MGYLRGSWLLLCGIGLVIVLGSIMAWDLVCAADHDWRRA